MPKLTVVPQTAPPAAEKLRQRIKRMPRPPTAVECRCGSRDFMPMISGLQLVDGKPRGGTKRWACFHCKAIAI